MGIYTLSSIFNDGMIILLKGANIELFTMDHVYVFSFQLPIMSNLSILGEYNNSLGLRHTSVGEMSVYIV